MTVTIKRYTAQDIQQCIISVEKFLTEDRTQNGYENHYKKLDIDKQKMYNLLYSKLSDPDFFCMLVFEDSEIVGGLCAYIAQPIFSSDRIAYDQLFYMQPDFKNLKAVVRLLSKYVEWAKERGAIECRMCSSTGYNQQGFTKLCNRYGFKQFEIGFVKEF